MQTVASLRAGGAFQSHTQPRAGRRSVVVCASDPLMQKPAVRPTAPSAPAAEVAAAPAAAAPAPAAVAAAAAPSAGSAPSLEYQRQQAKAMVQYFKSKKLEKVAGQTQVFGWTRKNEISNGRWVMMGLAVGLLTEYATGVSFIDQLKLMISYMGIADVYE